MVVCALIHSVNPIDAQAAARLASGTTAAIAGGGTMAQHAAGTGGGIAPELIAQELLYYVASVGGLYSWWHFFWVEVDELRYESGFDFQKHYSSFWCVRFDSRAGQRCMQPTLAHTPFSDNSLVPVLLRPVLCRNIVDAVNLVAVPTLILPTTILCAVHNPQAAMVAEVFVPLSSLLQLTLALRMLQYVSLYRPLGPLLVTVGGMIRNIVQFFVRRAPRACAKAAC